MKDSKHIKEVIVIPQVLNFEDELVYATNIKFIENLFQNVLRKNLRVSLSNLVPVWLLCWKSKILMQINFGHEV